MPTDGLTRYDKLSGAQLVVELQTMDRSRFPRIYGTLYRAFLRWMLKERVSDMEVAIIRRKERPALLPGVALTDHPDVTGRDC
jgi:hypothetical protein